MLYPLPYFSEGWVQLAVALPAIIIGFNHFGLSAWYSIKSRTPNMDVLISLGSASAVIYSLFLMFLAEPGTGHAHLYFETAATIISLVLLGSVIESRALSKTSIQMGSTASLLPSEVRLVLDIESQDFKTLNTDQLRKNDKVWVNEGEKIPADARVIKGHIEVNEAAISGESMPVFKSTQETVLAGSIVVSGNAVLEVLKTGQDTLAGQMRNWIKSAQSAKPNIQKLGDKVSGIFVQIVVGIALSTFVLSYFVLGIDAQDALLRSIAVLVVSCPCAMGLATPTAVSVGLGLAAAKGILVKGGHALEKFAQTHILALDKTGTITTGDFIVEAFYSDNDPYYQNIIYQLEHFSSHPIARSILQNHPEWNQKAIHFETVHEKKGYGLEAQDKEGNVYLLGSTRIGPHETEKKYDLYLWKNGEWVAGLILKDQPVANLKSILDYFKSQSMRLFLVSGDKKEKVAQLADQGLPFEQSYAEVLPAQKMEMLEQWRKLGKTAMTGDGINDAPALAAADVAIVVGHGSDISKQQADFILLDKGLHKLEEAHRISNITLNGIKQNLFWAFAYNVVAIPVAAMGYLDPMWAALFMAMSDLVVIGNALRLRWVHRAMRSA